MRFRVVRSTLACLTIGGAAMLSGCDSGETTSSSTMGNIKEKAGEEAKVLKEKAGEAAEKVKEEASKLKEKAGEAAQNVKERAVDLEHKAADATGKAVEKVKEAVKKD